MKRKKIVCLGDSLTYGFPYGPQASWVTYAAKTGDFDLGNAGINGDIMEGMAARFDRDVLRKKPQAVIILGGTNDAFCEDITTPMTIFSLQQMIGYAADRHIVPVIGLPLPIDDTWADPKLERLCREYRQISAACGALLLDFRGSFIDPDTGKMKDELYLDGVHPNLLGYRVMGEVAASFLASF
ncbi:MAG: GDSL-type esterase/lipase family protein [Thermacetogeniaceae bacterium]